jgi:hypothetical protein
MPRRLALLLTSPRSIPSSSNLPTCSYTFTFPVHIVFVQKRCPSPFRSITSAFVHKNTRVSGFVLANPEQKIVSPGAFFNSHRFCRLNGSQNTSHGPRTHNPFICNTYSRSPRRVSGFVLANPDWTTDRDQPKSSARNSFRCNTYRLSSCNSSIRNTYKKPREGWPQAKQFLHSDNSLRFSSSPPASCQCHAIACREFRPISNEQLRLQRQSGVPRHASRVHSPQPSPYFLYFPYLLYLLFHPTRYFLFTNGCGGLAFPCI